MLRLYLHYRYSYLPSRTLPLSLLQQYLKKKKKMVNDFLGFAITVLYGLPRHRLIAASLRLTSACADITGPRNKTRARNHIRVPLYLFLALFRCLLPSLYLPLFSTSAGARLYPRGPFLFVLLRAKPCRRERVEKERFARVHCRRGSWRDFKLDLVLKFLLARRIFARCSCKFNFPLNVFSGQL